MGDLWNHIGAGLVLGLILALMDGIVSLEI